MSEAIPVIDSSLEEALKVLLESRAAVSGRRIAQALGVSPTTAGRRLKALRDLGLAVASPAGSAVLWQANDDSPWIHARRRALALKSSEFNNTALGPADTVTWTQVSSDAKPRLKVVVLTALQLEHAAVHSFLNEVLIQKTASGTRYDVGVIRGKYLDWQVFLAEIGMGNSGAAAETAAAILTFSPNLVLFVGVAGGLKADDQAHGDVVVASMVYNVHSAKLAVGLDGGPEILSRPYGVPASHRMKQFVSSISRKEWFAEVTSVIIGQQRNVPTARPAVHLKPIVAGDVVLADANSELRMLIAERFNDAAAIDMESYGLYETAFRYDALPVLAIRGLSDLIGDKNPARDREIQPQAVANAAAFAVALLYYSEEDDLFPPRSGSAGIVASQTSQSRDPNEVRGRIPPAEVSLARLAPALRPWWRRFRSRHGAVADLAIADLAEHSVSPVGWLGRIRHRPPEWLDRDQRGDALALAAWFADSHGSARTTEFFDQAAEHAERSGEVAIAGLHRLQAALSVVRHPPTARGAEDTTESARNEALRRLSDNSLHGFGPIISLCISAVKDDVEAIVAISPSVTEVLGLRLGFLESTDRVGGKSRPDDGSFDSAVLFAELSEADPDIADQFRGDILLMIGYAFLESSEADSAAMTFSAALRFTANAAAPLLGKARAQLYKGRVARSSREVSSDLAEAEELALLARDRRRAWNGNSAEAVVVAARARIDGDPRGALRLTLPAPRGIATDAEAIDGSVSSIAAVAALYAGETNLALEIAPNISDLVERDLVRATALNDIPGMGDEAEQALRRALQHVPDSRPDQFVRALIGLVQRGVPVSAGKPGTVAPELVRLRKIDAEAADLVDASAALRSNQPRQALILARQYPTSVPAVEIAAEAAVANGDTQQAFRILDRAGSTRGDNVLRTKAMYLAADSGLDDEAQQVAAQLALSHDAETRRHALEVQLELASRKGDWPQVTQLGHRLLDGEVFDLSDVRRDQHVVQYRWAIAGAEFNLRQLDRARKMLDEPEQLAPRNPTEALILLTTLRATAPAPSEVNHSSHAALAQPILERTINIASAFSDDEEVVAAALKVFATYSGPDPLPDKLLARIRQLQEEFFEHFPSSTHFHRISIGDDLSGLAEFLRANFQPNVEATITLARQTWLGICPQVLFAEMTGRSYAETLVKQIVGCLVAASPDPAIIAKEQEASRKARELGTVVVDTSALVMLGHLGDLARRLIAQFDRVLFSASLRDDVLEARKTLALRSSTTLGWDPRHQRPQLTDIPDEIVERWAREGSSLAELLQPVEIVPAPTPLWSWDHGISLADREHAALWADDLALRHVARAKNIRAFGTLDLVNDLVDSGELDESDLNEVIGSFKRARVVDLPIADSLPKFAATDAWKPDGYAALYLARPRFWSQPGDGFTSYSRLIHALPPSNATADDIVAWAAAAMTGLAWATPPATRLRPVAALLAWTVLNKGGADIFPKILDAGENIMAAAAPAGDLLAHTVSVLTDTFLGMVPADQVGTLFTQLLVNFEQPRRARVMQYFFNAPH